MKRFNKLATAVLALSLIGSSVSGMAFAHDGKGGRGPGPMMDGKGGRDAGPMMGDKGGHGMMGHSNGRGGKGGHGMMGGVHQSKYMSLLVKAYAPDTKSDWDTYLKAESELQTQEDAFFKSLTKPTKRIAPPKPDQTTIDAQKAANDAHKSAMKALSDAIIADKDADVVVALKSLLTANKQLLVLRAQQFEALKKAIADQTTTTPNASPSTSSLKSKGVPTFLQEL